MRTQHLSEHSVGPLAQQAAHAVRALNHRTRPNAGGLTDPLDTADLIAELAHLTGMLPQLLGQLGDWLEAEHHLGRPRVDPDAPHPDPEQTIHALTSALRHAAHTQQRTAHALDTAHQHAAHLAAINEPTTINNDEPAPST